MPTITKTLQYQGDDGTWGPFNPTTQNNPDLISLLVDFDNGAYQVRIPGNWPKDDIENTIESETNGYIASQTSQASQISDLTSIIS